MLCVWCGVCVHVFVYVCMWCGVCVYMVWGDVCGAVCVYVVCPVCVCVVRVCVGIDYRSVYCRTRVWNSRTCPHRICERGTCCTASHGCEEGDDMFLVTQVSAFSRNPIAPQEGALEMV